MIQRALLLGWLSLATAVHAQEPKNADPADQVRALQRRILDLETIGRTKVLQERGLTPLPRPAVNTAYNVETFAPVTARFVCFTVSATVNGGEPCLDAFEIYGPGSPANLTEGARTAASSLHKIGHFPDGRYGKGWCWVSKEPGKGWVQVELPAPTTIDRVVWSRDALNRSHDRTPSVYKVEISEDAITWHTVATGEDRAAPGHDPRISRSTLLKALDPTQQQERLQLVAELRKLGAPVPHEFKSGPQVGEGISGRFPVLCLNGDRAGKNCCPV